MRNIHQLQEALIRTTKVLAGKNLPVYLEGFAPRVEYDTVSKKPVRIFLPIVPDNAPPTLLQAIHGFIDHECSHVLFSDAEDITDTTKNKLWHYIHNCIEDPRVNKAMGNHFPGSKKNIKQAYNFIFNELRDDAGKSAYTKEYVESLDLSTDEAKAKFHLQFASLWFAGRVGCPLSREKYHELHLDSYYDDVTAKCDPDMLRKLDKVSSAADVREQSDYWTDFFNEEILDKMQPNPEKGEKGEEKSKDAKSDIIESLESLEDQLAKAIEHKLKECVIESKEYIYWTDRFDKKYDKHDIVKEVTDSHTTPSSMNVASFEEKTKQVTNYMAKDLRRLLEEQRRRYYIGGYKSGKLNSKSLFSVRVGNDRIFKKKNDIRDINAAVSLLIDMSGSMRSDEKVYTAMQSAYAYAMTLQQLQVPYEIYGFVTENYDNRMLTAYHNFIKKNPKVEPLIVNSANPERIYAFKEFDEPFDITSKTAMTGAGHGGCRMIQNEDSKHVMLALKRLSVRPERVKALFVFSDGMPAYNFQDHKRAYDQLKFLADNAKPRYGVDVYSVGIKSECVSKFYEKYKVIKEVSELPSAMFDFLRKIFG
jgi:hypothetical protein